jgi:hypothetical protein
LELVAKKTPKSRAFIVGNGEDGLTLIITEPVMVVHYSIEDLKNGRTNNMRGTDPKLLMAALVQELIPTLRGVAVEDLYTTADRIETSTHGTYSLADEKAVHAELNYAQTIASFVNGKGATVIGVDFCIGLDIVPCGIQTRARSVSPGQSIYGYIDKYGYCEDPKEKFVSTHAQNFPISGLKTDNLGPLEPWRGPGSKPPAPAKKARAARKA